MCGSGAELAVSELFKRLDVKATEIIKKKINGKRRQKAIHFESFDEDDLPLIDSDSSMERKEHVLPLLEVFITYDNFTSKIHCIGKEFMYVSIVYKNSFTCCLFCLSVYMTEQILLPISLSERRILAGCRLN